jgi:hypothetical protein
METEYTVARTTWWGGRFSARTRDGRELYVIRVQGSRARFVVPGDDQLRFELRTKSFFSSEQMLVESAVDYTFGSIKPVSSMRWEVRDVAGAPLGTLVHAATTLKPVNMKGMSTWKALKEFGAKYKELARHLEFQVGDKATITFDLAKDYKSVSVKVVSQSKGIDERFVLAMAIKCLTAQGQQNSG